MRIGRQSEHVIGVDGHPDWVAAPHRKFMTWLELADPGFNISNHCNNRQPRLGKLVMLAGLDVAPVEAVVEGV